MPADRQTEAMHALFVIGYAAHPDKWIGQAEVYEIIESHAETGRFPGSAIWPRSDQNIV